VFGSNDTDVFTVVHFRGSNLATGKETDQDLHHWFRFRDDKICYYLDFRSFSQLRDDVTGPAIPFHGQSI